MARIGIALLALAVLAGGGYWFIFGQESTEAALSYSVADPYGEARQPGQQGQAGQGQTTSAPQQAGQSNAPHAMRATLHTTKGDITIEFMGADAPNTVANFTKLAKEGYYNDTKFHRVIAGFMIQGGDPLTRDDAQMARWGTGGPGYQFADEIHANNRNMVGTIAMANAGPDTNGSQFFINVADNNFLDGKHTVFGKVTTGMEVVHSIASTKTGAQDRPLEAIRIVSVTVE